MATKGRAATFWKDTPPLGKILIVGGAGALTIWGISAIQRSAEERAMRERLKNREQSDCEGVNLSAIAYNIWDACWNYGGGWAEDEDTMISELSKVPKSCIPQLAIIYNRDFSKNLFEDFRTYVEGEQYEQVRHLLE